ncbi:chorismate mutase [Pseudoalteromonas luteoviolacea]|uniref:Bifunctional chorismate mutase/prephenate dehydratase n=1 Tax=Pseudoalteromonas luteoviolacea S4054 TaxID=1129367 RepID=A0A0F6AFY5_9GAMM|nr:chorismate mutase [Pseudoalteromonas luteoviolacea]AOT09222.1 chorismate mutase [Pseudoalteromonas luteoviolacea]AOT14134.1 chorismate mutase [Pseudoalteromonas luteoviolacea]AOT19050.1 chorismate mutase [Pseudoalteromonas luteoviolacea]KKE85073.1 bifunctional chorismate mutase/prephenate dehydratase [Pseudoalteromonas luteoviolacea S4054]KZN70191.1 bifunctional chorismate mutase/prephenate dehydratase [Pseudoalteromonas luteoviolacea S4047-1]
MTQDTLNALRTEINEIDSELLVLLAKRRRISHGVLEYKINNNKPIRDEERELSLLEKLISYGKSLGLDPFYINNVFQVILEDSVLNQQALLQKSLNPDAVNDTHRVAYLGGQGSYSQLACHKYFSRRPGKVVELGYQSFEEITTSVENGKADFGILPIENTSSGSINEVFDLMQHAQVSIVGEVTHSVEHCLLAKPGTELKDVKKIFAHPQPFTQCSRFLQSLTDVIQETCDSTSSAIKFAAECDQSAAIGSAQSGRAQGLEVIKSELANQAENHSRFIVVARKPLQVSTQIPTKTSLIMATKQHVGSLADALMVFKENSINMTKLESRPVPGNPWEEVFYVDLQANIADPVVQRALEALKEHTQTVRILGCYQSESLKAVDPI